MRASLRRLGLGLLLLLLPIVFGLWLVYSETGLRLAWRIATPSLDALAGIQLEADQLSGRLRGPLHFTGLRYRDPWVAVEIAEGEIQWQPMLLLQGRVQIDRLAIGTASVTLLDAVYADGDAPDSDPASLPISVHIEQAQLHSLVFRTTADSDALHFEALQTRLAVLADRVEVQQLSTKAHGITGNLQGFIGWQGRFPIQLNAELDQPLPDASRLNTRLEAAGDLGQFQLSLNSAAPHPGALRMNWQQTATGYAIDLNGPYEPAPLLVALQLLPAEALSTGSLQFDARLLLDGAGIEAEKLLIRHGDSQLSGTAGLNWSEPALRWDARLDWQALALPPWAPVIHSESGQAQASGGVDFARIELEADYRVAEQAQGRTRLQALWQDGQFSLSEALLAAGDSRLQASGQLWPDAGLDWAIDSPQFGELWPAASGQIKGQGRLRGNWRQPQIDARLTARRLRLANGGIDRLDLTADINLAKNQPGQLRLNATGLTIATLEKARLQLNLRGQRSAHQLDVSLRSPRLSGQAQATGGWEGSSQPWLGQLQALSLTSTEAGDWRLGAPVNIQAQLGHIDVGEACLRQDTAQLCLRGQLQENAWQGQARLSALPLVVLNDYLPAELRVQGKIDGQAELKGADSQWQTVKLTAQAQASLRRSGQNEALSLALQAFSVDANPQGWQGQLDLGINGQGRVQAEASGDALVPDWQQLPLQARLRLALPDLRELAVLAPEIERLRGGLQGHIQTNGPLATPQLRGQLVLENGRLDLRDYGISLKPLTATLSARDDGQLALNLRAVSGDGTLLASGQISPDWTQPRFNIQLRGQQFLAARTEEATVRISPDLNIRLDNRQLELTGDLLIPEALLQPGKPQAGVQTVSADQVLVQGQQPVHREPGWQLLARLRLVLGEKVFFRGMGLDTRLGGLLDIRESPGRRTVANGEIRLLDGAYEVYGQRLELETGRLIFANAPVTEPALDIRATRKPRPQIKVGVRVRGLLDAPDVTLFSTPSMRQAEQLSWLVLGRPLEGNEGNPTLAGAALALGLNRGDRYIKGLSESLHVDDIGIETEPGQSAEQASLVVGKYLSPRLYVSYGAGLFEPLHRLRMRYRLNERWTLTGESGTAQGADILYTIERK